MDNHTMLQFFHWYSPNDGNLWNELTEKAKHLREAGITMLWLPPAYKAAAGDNSVGYDAYDLYDLGEFDQKGGKRTKYGTKAEYLRACKAAHAAGISVFADAVLNHKGGGDELETFHVRKVDPDDRHQYLSESYEIEAWTKFTFPARQNKYSSFIWDFTCFTGVDYDHQHQETAIFTIQQDYHEEWETLVDDEMGNYDYLMYCDLEFRNPHVRDELKRWGEWFIETTGADGFRLDAIKHITPYFYNEWLDHLRAVTGKPLFTVGEYWHKDVAPLDRYVQATQGRIALFDAPLHYHFYAASMAGKAYNLPSIFDGSLVQLNPTHAVTLVENHDSQPMQALESPVEWWFKPIAYALILLREQGLPCVFYPDLYGATYHDYGKDGNEHKVEIVPTPHLPALLQARQRFAYGAQHEFLDHPNVIGWTREGIEERPESGCAVIVSNGDEGWKAMRVGERHAGKIFVDFLGTRPGEITLNEHGQAEFPVNAGSVAVWVNRDALNPTKARKPRKAAADKA